MSDIYNLEDALKTISAIGELTNRKEKASEIANSIHHSFGTLRAIQKKVMYLIWKGPYMAAGRATFIGDMLHRIGLENAIEGHASRYPEVSVEEIRSFKPEFIFLSSEPYPFKKNHILELQEEIPGTKIILVDGELFSWYGSRLLKSVSYFNELLREQLSH
jgi:ABC-type Fe3+-hydroxamate transport system substrate-binding protein